jgi:hypothetical protein
MQHLFYHLKPLCNLETYIVLVAFLVDHPDLSYFKFLVAFLEGLSPVLA